MKVSMERLRMWFWRGVSVFVISAVLFTAFYLAVALGMEQSSTCTSATVLTETVNITGSPIVTVTDCDWGCDANTRSCKPHPLVQEGIFFGLCVGAVSLLYFLLKK